MIRRPSTDPTCTQCGGRMRLARILPQIGAYPELRTFECARCANVATEPMPWNEPTTVRTTGC